MAKTNISWSDYSWNPTVGCTRVSEACRYCYAERVAQRLRAMGKPEYQDVVDDDGHWTGMVRLCHERLEQPLHWRKPRRIFVDSMSDLFHENEPRLQRSGLAPLVSECVMAVALAAPQHTFMILTKRPERMHSFMTYDLAKARIALAIAALSDIWGRPIHDLWPAVADATDGRRTAQQVGEAAIPWPPPNVWLGVSVENQRTAAERIPKLLGTPAAVRFASLEPLLSPVQAPDMSTLWNADARLVSCLHLLDWIIIGGLSGKGWEKHPLDMTNVREIVEVCDVLNIPVFLKQAAGPRPGAPLLLDGKERKEWPTQ